MLTIEELKRRRSEVEDRLVAAGALRGSVDVVAVTKTFPAEVARLAVAAGLDQLGENYAQELLDKDPQVPGASWHFIGGLQRNKVRKLAPVISLWQTVDRIDLASEISKRAHGARVLIQVNTTGEAQKSGCEPDDVEELVERSSELGLRVSGLMTVGPTSDGDPRRAFSLLRAKVDRLGFDICSMGMSGDLEAAVAEGTTMVRVGTALFGPRPRIR